MTKISENTEQRVISKKYLNENYEIAIFENDIVRLALKDRNLEKCEYQLLDEIVYLEIKQNEILWQIIRDGIKIDNKEYMFFTATTGQVRNTTVTLIRKDFFQKYKGFLMVGLTLEYINVKEGMNVGKYLAYNALLLSSSVRPEKPIDIDRCVVVKGLETVVTDRVKYIDIQKDDAKQCYVADTPEEYVEKSIPIEHTDGAGMFLPGEQPASCQIRGGYIKGAMFPFDFKAFCTEVANNTVLVDAWGQEHDIIEEDIRYIFTTSQLKMYKFYESWDDYKEKFKKNGVELTINSYANLPKDSVSFSYQFLQTLPYNVDISELCKPAIEDLEKLHTDIDYTKEQLGYTLDANDKNYMRQERDNYYIAKALDIYPELIHDSHVMKKIKNLVNARRKSYKGGKIPVQGYYSYVAPDMYAFCEYLFMGKDEPEGLVPRNCVYNQFYDDEKYSEVLCLRSPHLSRYEYPRRTLLHTDDCKEWFKYMTSDTVVSCHDLISKSLQCDWDGDEILISPDEALLKAAGSLPEVPLFYDMQDADRKQITDEAIYNTLVAGFDNNVIGESSNAITKLWNSPELKGEPLKFDDMINVICAYSNYAIDFPKTGKNLALGRYEKLYNDLIPSKDKKEIFKEPKIKFPQFFKFAKDRNNSLADYTDSPMDRIAQYIEQKSVRKHYKYMGNEQQVGKFDYRMLMNNEVDEKKIPLYEVNRQDNRYRELYQVVETRKRAKQDLLREIQEESSQKKVDSADKIMRYELFHYYCIREIRKIFTNKKGLFNVNLAVNYFVDMEYNHRDLYTTSKDTLWKCFGNILVDNLNQNMKTGITLKERPRMSYWKAAFGDDELDQTISEQMQRKSVQITQADIAFMDAVLKKKKNGDYYNNDVEMLFGLLCHYKYAKEHNGLDKNNVFHVTKKKHVTKTVSGGKGKRKIVPYNMNTIMTAVGAKSYAKSFERFNEQRNEEREQYICITGCEKEDKQYNMKIPALEESDDTDVLFTVQDIYNPMVYLQAYYNKKELVECVICGKHFIKCGNQKTCSERCRDKYHKMQVANNNQKNRTAAKVEKKVI